MKISEHITFEEAITSPTALRLGIDNQPNNLQLANMERVAEMCFEPLRLAYGKPIKVNSFFRCDALNKAVKGSKSSQHCTGEAIDITAGGKEENKKLFDWCKANLQFDQLINEYDYSWVHVSYKLTGNRNMVLIIK